MVYYVYVYMHWKVVRVFITNTKCRRYTFHVGHCQLFLLNPNLHKQAWEGKAWNIYVDGYPKINMHNYIVYGNQSIIVESFFVAFPFITTPSLFFSKANFSPYMSLHIRSDALPSFFIPIFFNVEQCTFIFTNSSFRLL